MLTVQAGTVPWDRFPPVVYWVIPLLDFVAIAPLWTAARYAVDGMSLLSAFPMFWLAWSGVYPVLALTLGFVGTAVVSWWPYLPGTSPFPDELVTSHLGRPALVPFLILAIGVAASVLTRSMDRQRLELGVTLERADGQNRLLNAVVETSDVGILAVDRDGHDILMNQAQRRLHFLGLPAGMDDGTEADLLLFEADGTTAIPPADRPVARAVRGEDYRGLIVAIGTDGAQQHLSVSASALYDAQDRFDGTVVVFQNVTDLIHAINTRERITAEVSHEFRTPLTSIIGYLDLALEEDLDPALRGYLRTSQRNAERLLTLVTALLDSAEDSSRVTVQQVNLARLVRNSVESVQVQAAKAGVGLTADLPEQMDARVDPVKLGQVVDNLLSNAVKYTPDGGSVAVTLRHQGCARGTEAGEDAGAETGVGAGAEVRTDGWAELAVADTGHGMSEAELERLFTSFYRAEHVRNAAIPGTGLGLAITQGFVRAHGGEILVASEQGVGSTFTVRIPLAGPAA